MSRLSLTCEPERPERRSVHVTRGTPSAPASFVRCPPTQPGERCRWESTLGTKSRIQITVKAKAIKGPHSPITSSQMSPTANSVRELSINTLTAVLLISQESSVISHESCAAQTCPMLATRARCIRIIDSTLDVGGMEALAARHSTAAHSCACGPLSCGSEFPFSFELEC